MKTETLVNENGIVNDPLQFDIKDNERVHITKDYSIFNRVKGNRKVHNKNLNRLKESMKEKDLRVPIIVNEHLEVIDGQHRLQARIDLELPVYYIIISGLGEKDIQVANLNNRNWKSNDFLNFYCEHNFSHYKLYKEFKERYQFGHHENLMILATNGKYEDFQTGNFYVSDINKSNDMAEKLYTIEPYYKGFKRRSFIMAMIIALNNDQFDFNEFITKLSYQSSKLVDCTNKEQYLHLIDEIYNYKKKVENKIRFT